jgi:hypothetical protein
LAKRTRCPSFPRVSSVQQLLFVSAIVMGASHTIAKERIFLWLRNACGGGERFLGYLVSCPYCVSHYVAFVLVPLTGSRFIAVPWNWGMVASVLEWLFSSLLVTVVAAFLRVGFYFVDETQGWVRRRLRREDLELEERRSPH